MTVQIQHTTRDATGDPVSDGDPVTVRGCIWWPGSTSEQLERRDEVTATSTLSVPYGTDVRSADEVTLPSGDVWQVNGVAAPYNSPFTGWAPGSIVTLQRTVG